MSNFFKNHADTLSIIGVNVGIAAILITMWISNCHRIDSINDRMDSTNIRMDQVYNVILDIVKEKKN